ncbi:MAG: phospholipase D-like domain-containing protein [Flavobacteriales bacterium]|jgi:hypothetical protein|nr:phospholipase D-like domain-containing protein [Flavobacteriales bacterium]
MIHLVRSTLFSFVCTLTIGLSAQTVSDARNASLGSSVTVSGIITSDPSLGSVRYVQDATGGIAAFPGSGSAPGFAPNMGDAITLTGTLTNYSGLLEITPITAFTVTSSGNALPAAQVITPNGLNESVEGEIVRLEGMTFNASGTFASNTYIVQSGGQQADVYLRTGHPMIGTPIPAGAVDITGIASQFDPSSPYTSGYQLLPRATSDITPFGSIAVLPPMTQAVITPTGFTLNWQTNQAGTSQVFYGTTPALGQLGGDASMGTSHSAVLAGLASATFYYAKVFSVDGSDTAFSQVGLYSTASPLSGGIKVYFNKSVDHSVSSGTDAIALFDAVDDTIKAYIDRAETTLDIAMYNTNSDFLVAAVNAAYDRGVTVRWVAEGSTSNWALNSLDPAIPVLYRTDGLGSGTHDKFFVIDAEDASKATIMSGSCNWTTQGFFDDYNNLVFIQDQALARCYRAEFEEMWGGSGAQPVPSQSKFGADKTDNTPHLFNVGGTYVESFFSPTDGVTARIARALDDAQHNVRLALYVLTENTLGDAIIAANNRPGMLVAGDVEDIYTIGSEFNYLVGQGVNLVSHLDEPGLFHHKYAIIDEGFANDLLVITGSHNWTTSAETVNDENTLIIHNASITNQFYQEWNARHNAVVGITETEALDGFAVWPVPATEVLNVLLPADGKRHALTLVDALGRTVIQVDASGNAQLNLGNIPAGVYLLRCEGFATPVVRRVVIAE